MLSGDFNSLEEFAVPIARMVCRSPHRLPSHADLIYGHPSCSTLRIAGRSHLVTVLRGLRSRLLSHCMVWRIHSNAELAEIGSQGDPVRLALGSMAGLPSDLFIACQIDNLATRMLLWPHPLIPADGSIGCSADALLPAETRLGSLRLR